MIVHDDVLCFITYYGFTDRLIGANANAKNKREVLINIQYARLFAANKMYLVFFIIFMIDQSCRHCH